MTRNKNYLFAGILLVAIFLLVFFGFNDKSPYLQQLEDVGAKEAMSLANSWRKDNKEISSYVTSEDIVFELPEGSTRKVALPKDEMVVSVAPYVHKTHR